MRTTINLDARKGLGYIEAHLLASVTLTDGAQLWTRDKCLAQAATDLQLI